jgi:hypothetical protein
MPTPDPILKMYVDLITSKTKVFRGIYFGDPVRIPVSMLPALIAAKKGTLTSPFSNTEDVHKTTLVFTVVTDIRADFSDETTMVPGNATLYDLMEGRDSTTMALKVTSLLGILRSNVNIDQEHQVWTDIDTPTRIDYGLVMNKRQQPSWSIEGALTTVASIVQSRQ